MSYYYDNDEEAKDKRIDSDLSSAIEYAIRDTAGFRFEDVALVLASVMGENDGPDYYWIIAMKDHTYAYITGGCDYTGWDCQAGGTVTIYPTLRQAIEAAPEKDDEYGGGRLIRKSLELQLTGKLAFGEATPETQKGAENDRA